MRTPATAVRGGAPLGTESPEAQLWIRSRSFWDAGFDGDAKAKGFDLFSEPARMRIGTSRQAPVGTEILVWDLLVEDMVRGDKYRVRYRSARLRMTAPSSYAGEPG